jgi:hypothetical protein
MIPIPWTALRILGIFLWCSGIGMFFQFKHTRSPNTPLDPKLSVCFNSGKIHGLNQIHAIETIIKNKDHQPNHTLLNIAIIRIG